MALSISTTSNTNGPWSVSNSTVNDIYDAQRYYAEQEHLHRQAIERQRYAAMQNTAYNPHTQAQREQQAVKPKQPEYTSNKKLLLLEN